MERLSEGIYRICIPFENIYTSVFALVHNNKAVILDSGSNDSDAETYVVPNIKKLNMPVKYLVSTHTHSDHYGGINALKAAFPDAICALFSKDEKDCYYLTDGEMILERFQVLSLKGHTEDSIGILDTKTKTLLSGDCLQMHGVGRFKTIVTDKSAYLQTLQRVRKLNLTTICCSHEYEPCGSIVHGKEIAVLLMECENAVT